MFSLKMGCGDWVFLAAASLKLLFCDLLLIIYFFHSFFRVYVVLEAFFRPRWGEKIREQQPIGRTTEICVLIGV